MSRRAIDDEFKGQPLSKQRKYQLRKQRDGLCVTCGEPAVEFSSRCLKHLVHARELMRKKRGVSRRYINARSYKVRE